MAIEMEWKPDDPKGRLFENLTAESDEVNLHEVYEVGEKRIVPMVMFLESGCMPYPPLVEEIRSKMDIMGEYTVALIDSIQYAIGIITAEPFAEMEDMPDEERQCLREKAQEEFKVLMQRDFRDMEWTHDNRIARFTQEMGYAMSYAMQTLGTLAPFVPLLSVEFITESECAALAPGRLEAS